MSYCASPLPGYQAPAPRAQATPVSGLRDNFVHTFLMMTGLRGSYEYAVFRICQRVTQEFSSNWKFWTWFNGKKIQCDLVEFILNCYTSLRGKNQIPAFSKAHPELNEKIVPPIIRCLGLGSGTMDDGYQCIVWTLRALEDLVVEGAIDVTILDPYLAKINEDDRSKPDSIIDNGGLIQGFGDVLDTVKTIAVLVAVGAAAYYGIQVVKELRST